MSGQPNGAGHQSLHQDSEAAVMGVGFQAMSVTQDKSCNTLALTLLQNRANASQPSFGDSMKPENVF